MSIKLNVHRSANTLQTSGLVILLTGVIGGVVLIVLGFQPVCPPGSFDCFSSAKGFHNAPLFTGIALAQVLLAWFLFALSSAFSDYLRLKVAESGLQDSAELNEITPQMGWSDKKKMTFLSEDQLTDWILGGEPSLASWDVNESFEEWLRKNAKKIG